MVKENKILRTGKRRKGKARRGRGEEKEEEGGGEGHMQSKNWDRREHNECT